MFTLPCSFTSTSITPERFLQPACDTCCSLWSCSLDNCQKHPTRLCFGCQQGGESMQRSSHSNRGWEMSPLPPLPPLPLRLQQRAPFGVEITRLHSSQSGGRLCITLLAVCSCMPPPRPPKCCLSGSASCYKLLNCDP